MDQEGMNGPLVVDVRLPPVRLPIRVFIGVFDAVDLVAQPINLIEKGGRARAHDLEMLSVAGQKILPARFPRHEHLTRSFPSAAPSAVLLECPASAPLRAPIGYATSPLVAAEAYPHQRLQFPAWPCGTPKRPQLRDFNRQLIWVNQSGSPRLQTWSRSCG